MNTQAGSYINSRLVSSSQKRQIMWNIIEPGDPYDIRKSMIAKLPGRKNFMGDHLQLVCLLQAAQIQRISQYVDEYKLKFRQIERRQLDRHSYEIQIKQLTQQLGDQGNYKLENVKLKQFLRKQTIQFEQMKKKAGGFEIDVSRKYQESLRQIDSLYQENQFIKSNLHKAKLDYQQALNNKNGQIDELQKRLRDATSRNSQFNQKTESYYKLQIEYKKLEFENKRIKQITQTKNKQIEQLQNKSKQLVYQVEQMNSQIRQYNGINHTITQYQNRFSLLGQEIDRLNLVLRQKTGELSDQNNRYKILEDDFIHKTEYIQQLERKKTQMDQKIMQMELKLNESMRNLSGLDESRSLVRTYEGNMEKLSSEVQRLNIVLRKKVQQLDQSNRKLSQYQYEIRKSDTMKHQVEDYRIKYSQFNKKFAEYENRIALLSQEIERLNINMKRKNEQCTNYEHQIKIKNQQIDSYHKKIYDLQFEYKGQLNRITHQNKQYQIEVAELIKDKEINRSKIKQLIQTVNSPSPSKGDLQMEKFYKAQIQKLNQVISDKNIQIQRMNFERFNSLKGDSKLFEGQKQRIIQQYQLQLSNKNKQIEKGRQILGQYQKRIITSLHEIERLNQLLKKNPSPNNIKNDQVKLQRKIDEYENKLAIINQELERANENLRIKGSQCKHLQAKVNHYEMQITSSRKRQIQNYQINISDLEKRISELQRDNRKMSQQINNYQDQLSRKSSDNQFTANINRQNQLKIRQLSEQNNSLNRKVNEYEFQLNSLSQQIQRLNNVLRTKVDQIGNLHQKNQNFMYEIEDSRRKISDLELKIHQINGQIQGSRQNYQRKTQYEIQNLMAKVNKLQNYKEQYESKIRSYQEQIAFYSQKQDRILGQFNDNKRIIAQYENKIVILSQQIQRLNELLNKFKNENTDLKRKIGEIDYLQSTIVTLEEKNNIATQENEGLRQVANESNLYRTKLSQDFEQKVRNLTQKNDELERKCHEFQSKLNYSYREVQHLNNLLKSKIQQNSNYDSKVRNMFDENQQLSRKVQELSNANRKIAEYDGKISMLSQEIQRLNEILKIKIGQIHNLEEKCRSRQNQLIIYQRKMEEYQITINRDLQMKIQFISNQNQQLKVKLKQLTSEVNKIPEFQSKFAMVYTQIQRLNNILTLKNEEISAFESKYRKSQDENIKYRRKNDELQQTIHRELKNQSSVFEQRVRQLTQQNNQLRNQNREIIDENRKIPEYENQLTLLSKQIQRLNQVLVKYSKQMIPNIEGQARSLSFENEDLKRKITQLSEINKGNQQLLAKYKVTIQQNEQYHRRIQQYQSRMNNISGQVQRLNSVMRAKVDQLNQSDKRLRQAIKENQILKEKLKESEDINRYIPQYKNQLAITKSQIERLNGVLKIKNDENNKYDSELRKVKYQYESIQRKYTEVQLSLKDHKDNRNIYEQKISSFNQQNQQLRRNIRQLSDSNRKVLQYQSRMILLSQEIQRMNGNLRNKVQQLSQYQDSFRTYKRESQSKIAKLNNQIQDYRRKTNQNITTQSNKIAQYQNKILLLSQQIERLNYVLKEHIYEIQLLQKKQQQYLSEIERLNNTLRLKVEETTRWEQSNNQLRSRIKSYEQNINLASSEYQKIKIAHNTLNQEHNKANKHLVQYQQSINKLYQQFQRIQGMLQQYKKQNYELKVQLQEFGNLVQKNRALSTQIDRLNGIIKVQNKDLQDLRLSLSDQAALQKRINEYMAMMVILFAEIESLRQRVKDTQIEIQSVRRSSLAPFKV